MINKHQKRVSTYDPYFMRPKIVHFIECMCIMHACSLSNPQSSINQFKRLSCFNTATVYSGQQKNMQIFIMF